MKNSFNKLTHFWQELKRRRVIHVITVYASAAFVIIELAGNLTEPLNLPPGLATIFIIVLAVGFSAAIILSWYYDLTGQGIERTIPLSEIKEEEKQKVPNAWKIATYVSFLVIIGLVTFNIVGGTQKFRAGDMKSLLILPIDNYTGDDSYDDFISGMHSVLISDVGRISGLSVKGKITSVACADKPAEQIAAELGVDVVIKPTIMCLADSFCFQMKAVTSEGEEIWISDFREPKSQLINLGNLITKEIAEEVNIKLTDKQERMLAEARTVDPDAYEAYVIGRKYWDQLNQEDLELARRYYERAIEIDPDWAPPYAGLAITWAGLRDFGNVPYSIALSKHYEYLNRALEMDPDDAFVQSVVAGTAIWTEWNWEKGERAFIKSLELNPNNAWSRIYYAHLLSIQRKSDAALDQARLAMKLDTLNPLIMGLYVVVLVNNGKCEEALNYIEKAISLDPDHVFLAGLPQQVYECLGDYEKAFEEWKKRNSNTWEKFGVTEILDKTFRELGWIAFLEEITRINLEVMAIDFRNIPWEGFNRYLRLGKYDKAMDYLEIIDRDNIRGKYLNLPYQSQKSVYDKMKDNPRYIAFLKKMNLPVE